MSVIRSSNPGLRVHYRVKETIVTIGADCDEYIEVAKKAIQNERRLLEGFIIKDPFFKVTLEPYEVPASAPGIVRRMAEAARVMGIGPMGAVAGTIAAYAVEAMLEEGALYAFVDNGGDIALVTDRPLVLGIYAGEASIKDLALEVQPTDEMLGICTSSGTVGPSISFGSADAALVVSRNVSLADAAATALGNAVVDEGTLEDAFVAVRNINGIQGALVVKADRFAVWGGMPRVVRAKMKPDHITRG
ncbi:MAG: UPF0280 family protein [ANME-2 cluster archaeon]|nr:UPF0280 family protein [ANME-2 cluster archaeon]